MYDFHYNVIKKHFGTDSLSKSENFIKNFLSTNICLTLVTIQNNWSFLMRVIKKIIGKTKDESEVKINNDFVGLKSLMYSIEKHWW